VTPERKSLNAVHQAWKDVPLEALSPLVVRQYIHGAQAMVARFELRASAVVPWHEHHNEQISLILEGRVRFHFRDGIEETVIEAVAGDTVVIPAHLPHQIEVLEDARAIDVFAPPRADWIEGNDAYLRQNR
jgi:quercetin dioxygenase-like cupin family protein